MDLVKKGESASIGSFKQLKVTLAWTSAVDLDLMAFYKTKDGRTGGVCSDNYSSGNMGDINAWPFMKLSGDAGVGGTGGDNREEMLVSKLDDMEYLEIVAVNFTDASSGANKTFSDYDARVEVVTDTGDSHTIRLDSSSLGSVATICKFSPSFMGLQLSNDSSVRSFNEFRANVAGASSLQLQSKVTLGTKGDSHVVKIKKKGSANDITVNLNWQTTADLDLGCFYELKNGQKSVIDGLQFSHGNGGSRDTVSPQGCYSQAPWIWHMGDDRSGSEMSNGEFILLNPEGYSHIKRLTIYAFIYEGVANWTQTDAKIVVNVPGNPEIIVEMGRDLPEQPKPSFLGSLFGGGGNNFCAIAGLDFLGESSIKVTKYISFHKGGHADCDKAYNWGMRWQEGSK